MIGLSAFLLPPGLRDWILEDDLVHFVIEAVERVDMVAFKVNHRGAQYHPRMMLALLIYGHANGVFRAVGSNGRPIVISGFAWWRPIAIPTTTRSRAFGGTMKRFSALLELDRHGCGGEVRR